MNKIACVAVIAALGLTGACKRVETTKISEAEATKISDDFLAASLSGDVAKIDAFYAKDVVAIDPVVTDVAKGRDTMHKFNQGFVDMKFDKQSYTDRHFQLLDAEDFIVTAKIHVESTAGQVKSADFRVTDYYRKQDDGSFKIVNEHASFAAKP
jgi:ketosteroid isomerase-like protein